MLLGPQCDEIQLKIGDTVLVPSDRLRLLGVIIDSNLKFDLHVRDMCAKVSSKASALARVRKFIPEKTRLRLLKAFVLPHLE